MPTASRPERRKHKLKREITLLQRQLRQVNMQAVNAQAAVLSLLHQSQGGFVVAKDTAEFVLQHFQHLYWTTERQEDGGITVTLKDRRESVTAATAPPEAPVASEGNIPLYVREPVTT